MGSVLIVHGHGESGVATAVASELTQAGHQTRQVRSPAEALASLSAAPADLVLCDTAPAECTGPQGLIQTLRRGAPKAAMLFLVGEAPGSLDKRSEAELSNPDVLRPPFSLERVRELVRTALDARKGFNGSVVGLQLVEVLQLFNMARRTASVLLEGATPGRIDFDRGSLVHAESSGATGTPAFQQLLAATGGRFRVTPRVGNARTIEASFEQLLMSSLQFITPPKAEAGENLGSWFPLDGDDALAPVTLPPPAPVPRLADPALVTRYRHARASLGVSAPQLLVLAVERASHRVTVLQGEPALEGLAEAVLGAQSLLDKLVQGSASGVFEYRAGRVALGLLWDRAEDAALLLADVVDDGSIGSFRAHVAAVSRAVLQGDGEDAKEREGA